jgi:hypothetical protein
MIDDFDVSIFLTELSTSHAILTRNKTFATKDTVESRGTKETPFEIDNDEVQVLREESDEEKVRLQDIPEAQASENQDTISISEDSDGSAEDTEDVPEEEQEDKKKMALNTTYDGFQIYGRILCLVVKRKDPGRGKQMEPSPVMMEDWISSTQAIGND